MDETATRIVIAGAAGRMGRMLTDMIAADPALALHGALEHAGHDWIGRDLGTASGGAALGVTVQADAAAVLPGADAVIDFTLPAATLALAPQAVAAGVAHVIGTTGFDAEQEVALVQALAGGVAVRSGNMSLGVNLLVQLVRQVAAALDADYDIEVVEAHHRAKIDAPSGTALMLGAAAAQGRGVTLDAVADRGRDGITGARGRGAIGFVSIRGGDVVGEHDVIFAGPGERLVLRHVASDRGLFARGALKAAQWARGKPPGVYSMLDVLGL